jgi:hypothetical protein
VAGCQLLRGGKEAQDGVTRAQGIYRKERRRLIGAPQMEKEGRVVQGCSPKESGRGGIQPVVATIKVLKVKWHRGEGETEGLLELYNCC